jgi:hypothetical protein
VVWDAIRIVGPLVGDIVGEQVTSSAEPGGTAATDRARGVMVAPSVRSMVAMPPRYDTAKTLKSRQPVIRRRAHAPSRYVERREAAPRSLGLVGTTSTIAESATAAARHRRPGHAGDLLADRHGPALDST